ncbi:M17 family peptidase N-terminal domain-containing protein, partial [Microcystis sp.]|uniref:M17 family peptidase N-terminal domain-containing protein n=1 Tax=Microcystis sp. TaxID=1127 RepID=UPI00391C6883
MDIRSTDTSLLTWTGDTLALGLPEGAIEIAGELAELNDKLGGILEDLISETEFEGKLGSSAATRLGGGPIRKLILVGLGKTADFDLQTLRLAAAAIARLAKQQKSQALAISLPVVGDQSATAGAIAEGLLLANHQDTRFKSTKEEKGAKLETVELLGLGEQASAIAKAEQICSGVILARELVNAPANTVTPLTMAETAEQIASEYGLSLKILEQEECESLGMGAFLGVAKASDIPPKFIHLIYKPQKNPKHKLAIVGKSLTFDSGGLNIKGAGSGIETMKTDMGGGAATLGAAKAIAQLQPEVEVHFICPATENMISGRA